MFSTSSAPAYTNLVKDPWGPPLSTIGLDVLDEVDETSQGEEGPEDEPPGTEAGPAAKEHGGWRVWGRWQGGWRGGWGGWDGWDSWGGGWDDGGWGSSSQQTLEIVTTCYLEDHGHGYHDMRTFCLRTSSTASSPSIGSNAPARSPTCMLLRQA